MRACWLKWVGRDWSISADYIWLNYSGANRVKFGGAGKIEEMLTRPQFSLPRTAVLVLKIALCSKVLDFPRTSVITSLDREYRQQ